MSKFITFINFLCGFLFLILSFAIIFFIITVKKRFSSGRKNAILRKRINYENILIECSKTIVSMKDTDKLLNYAIELIKKAFNTNKICIFLKKNFYDPESKFELCASYGISKISNPYFENKKIIKWLKNNQEIFIFDINYQLMDEKDFKELTKGLEEFDTMIVAPLIRKNDLIGFITLNHKKIDIFDIDDIQFLQTLANQFTIAIENAFFYKELDDICTRITRSLSIAVEIKEGYTIGHSDHVVKYAVSIAKKLGLDLKEIITIAHAAMLHDIGKIGIHDSILTKPDKLTSEEWIEMKTHSIKGAKILEPLPFMKDVKEIIKYHHERYDGNGYPDKLIKEQIPIGAQILNIADSFDAMISDRSYKKKLSVNEAVEELIKNKGKQFNPEFVDIFVEIIKENPNIVWNNTRRIEKNDAENN